MELFLLRHAEAHFDAPSDDLRELTDLGRAQLEAILRASTTSLSAVQKVWVSPLVRAQQTLEIARRFLPANLQATTTELLIPEENPQAILPLIARAQVESALLITHQPLVGSLLNSLCHLTPGERIMGTSALAALDITDLLPAGGTLRWLRQP